MPSGVEPRAKKARVDLEAAATPINSGSFQLLENDFKSDLKLFLQAVNVFTLILVGQELNLTLSRLNFGA